MTVLTEDQRNDIVQLIIRYPLNEDRVWLVTGFFLGSGYTFEQLHLFIEMCGKSAQQGIVLL